MTMARIQLEGATPRPTPAARLAEAAIAESPYDPEAYALMGRVFGEPLRERALAQSYYLKAFGLDPFEPRYRAAMEKYSDR